jgi:hypothetical protein
MFLLELEAVDPNPDPKLRALNPRVVAPVKRSGSLPILVVGTDFFEDLVGVDIGS